MRNVLNLTTIKQTLAGSSVLYRTTAVASMALAFGANTAQANPVGGQVISGNVTITNNGTQETITSTTNKSIINWQNFDIMQGESTRFIQPGVNSVSLNRVVAGQNASQILGTLTSNGRIVLVNPNGVFFGAGSKVDVAGMIASTADISDDNFLKNKMIFDKAGRPGSSIVNEGHITAANGGLVALVAPNVQNDGTITANAGTIELGAGSTVTVDMYGDNLYSFALGKADAPAGSKLGVSNTGVLTANAGTISLTANVAKNIVTNVVNNTGIIEASSAHVSGGTVVIGGGDGDVNVAGNINASGATAGGKVKITGNNITVAHDAKINVSATGTGNAGSVAIIADNATDFQGSIFATAANGNGGSVETSGKYLNLYGSVDASATGGKAGNWLLDPLNITISNGPDAFYTPVFGSGDVTATPNFYAANVNSGSLNSALATGTNVTITTQGTTGLAQGDITVLSNINWSTAASLTLDAVHDLFVGASITSTYAGIGSGGNINLHADHNVQIGLDGTNGTNGTFGTSAAGAIGGINGINGLNGLNGLNGSLTTAGGAVTITAANDIKLGGAAGNGGNGANAGNGGNAGNFFVDYNGANGGNGGKGGNGGNGGTASITTATGGITLDAGRDVILGNTTNGASGTAGNNGTSGSNYHAKTGGQGGTGGAAGAAGNASGAVHIISNSGDVTVNGTRTIKLNTSSIATTGKLVVDPADLVLDHSYFGGGSVDITAKNVTLTNGSAIAATGGDLDIHNTGIFYSDAGNTVYGTGHVYLNQNVGGSIQNAIDAIGDYGTDAKVTLGSGTFTNGFKVVGLDNFTVTGQGASTIIQPTSLVGAPLPNGTPWGGQTYDSAILVKDGSNDTLSNFAVDASNLGGQSPFAGVTFYNASGNATNLDINGHGNSTFGLYAVADSNYGHSARNFTATNVTSEGSSWAAGAVIGDNLTVDIEGGNYNGTGGSNGIDLSYASHGQVNNATVEGGTSSDHAGIAFHGAHDYTLAGNTIDGNGGYGILDAGANYGVTAANNITISGNTITNVTDGVYGQGGSTWTVNGNTITGATEDGIKLINISGATVNNNTLTNNATGIFVDPSSNITISGDTISGGNTGIEVLDTPSVQITGNLIHDVAGQGITIGTSGGTSGAHTLISGNVIYNTGADAIDVASSDYTDVKGNYVGYTDNLGTAGDAFNIHGDGILLDNSSNSTVTGNYVTATKSTAWDVGSGIHITNSHDDTIGGGSILDGNHVSNIDWDGIKLGSDTGIVVENNSVNGTARVGIYAGSVNGSSIALNDVTGSHLGAGYGAIQADFGSNLYVVGNVVHGNSDSGIRLYDVAGTNYITGNYVDGAGSNGIEAVSVNGLTVSYNDIRHAAGDGIYLNSDAGADVDTNHVTNVDGNGVKVTSSGLVDVTSNTISHVGQNGIFIDPSHYATVTGNVINNTGSNGVYVLDSDHAKVVGNYIGYLDNHGHKAASGNIQGDGVKLDTSNYSTVSKNYITNTKSTGDQIGSGIYVLGSHGDTIGGAHASDANHISNVDWDGIKLGSSGSIADSNITVSNNDINGASRVGIWGLSVDGLTVSHNDVSYTNSTISTYGGIDIESSNNVNINHNDVSHIATGAGIRVLGLTGHNSINDNHVSYVATNGIDAENNSDHLKVDGNSIYRAGNDGIYLTGDAKAEVLDNNISHVRGNGIDVDASAGVVIGSLFKGNDIDHARKNGILVNGSQGASVVDNDIKHVGANGIEVDSSAGAAIGLNEVDHAKKNGILVTASKYALILLNKIKHVGGNGIDVASSEKAKVGINEIRDAKKDGILVTSSKGATVAVNDVKYVGKNGIEVTGSKGAHIDENHVRDAKKDGILLTSSKGAEIKYNDIDHVGRNGVKVVDSAHVDVVKNDISHTGKNGIFIDPSNYALVEGNVINHTGSNGILIQDSDHARVIGNYVGYLDNHGHAAADDNIHGDGILLDHSDYSTVAKNYVTATKDGTQNGDGSGILLRDSFNDTVGGAHSWDANHITNIGHDGIGVIGGGNIKVLNNDISDVARAGIYGSGVQGLTIGSNHLSDTNLLLLGEGGPQGYGAIDVEGGSDIDVNHNHIANNVTGSGVRIIGASGKTSVTHNYIKHVLTDGVDVEGSSNVTVSNNHIKHANNGIYLVDISNADIEGNHIKHVHNDGIYAQNLYRSGDGEVAGRSVISGNHIEHFGYDGIELDTIENAYVVGNHVSHGRHDGISANNLYVNGFSSIGGGDTSQGGEHPEFRTLAEAGGNVPMQSIISDNDVYHVGHDGIHVTLIQNGVIDDNHVAHARHDGIYLSNAMPEETIGGGDSNEGGDNEGPSILLKPMLISVGNGSYTGTIVDGNHTSHNGSDGIHVDSVDEVVVSNNHSRRNGFAAIEVDNSEHAQIANNHVSHSADGILLDNAAYATVSGNKVRDNGIGVNVTDFSDHTTLSGDVFTGNTLGIQLDHSSFVGITGENLDIPVNGVGLRIAGDSRDAVVKSTHFNGGYAAIIINGGTSNNSEGGEGEGQKKLLLSSTPDGSSMSFGDNGSTFDGNTYYFILEDGAMRGKVLDASGQKFDGTRASDFTPDQLADAEGRISGGSHTIDVADDGNVGDVFYKRFNNNIDTAFLSDFQNDKHFAYRRGRFSFAGRSLNMVADPIKPGSFNSKDMNLSLLGKASPTAAADIANLFATLAPAAGGNHKGKANPSSPAELAALAPAAGGPAHGSQGNGNANVGNSFLSDGYNTGFAQ